MHNSITFSIFVTSKVTFMNFVNILLIIIIILLIVYCGRLKLSQHSSNDELSPYQEIKAEVSNNDVMQYIRDVTSGFRPFMESRQIDFSVKCTPESMMGWIDTDKMDKMILVLLSDMLKNASAGTKVHVEANTTPNYDIMRIRLTDNSKKRLNTSIVIARQLTVLHHGTFKSKFDERQGNMVLIEQPITKEAFHAELEGQERQTSEEPSSAFHIPANITLHIPTISLPETADMENKSLEELVQEAFETPDQKFLQRAIKCVNDHIDDCDYDRESFAADMGASSSSLYNKLRALTGKNISTFIRDIRIQTACKMAKANPDLRISDIAYRVGFRDPKYFATSFKRVMGAQPKEYFDKLREESQQPTLSGESTKDQQKSEAR